MKKLGYKLPGKTSLVAFCEKLSGDYLFVVEHSIKETKELFDTYDWRLYRREYILRSCEGVVSLVSLVDDQLVTSEQIEHIPAFLWEFPESDLKKRLASIIEMRALLSLGKYEQEITKVRILNPDEKTVAWLEFTEVYTQGGEKENFPLIFLWLQEVRGYNKYYEALDKRFRTQGFQGCRLLDCYNEIISAAGRRAGGYSSKVNIQLDPEMRIDHSMKTILRVLSGVIRSNEAGIKDDIDTEFLHDFRVSIRRTRSALTQIKGIFPPSDVDRFRRDFAALGQLTNPLRDLDVYLLSENAYKSRLPEPLQNAIDPLFDYFREKRQMALFEVVKGLDNPDYELTLSAWNDFLEAPQQVDGSAPNAHFPVFDVACAIIYKRYKRVVKDGAVVLKNIEDQMLHALRIECKKLRYLIEFFSSLFPAEKVDRVIKQLKILQDNLGDFNDLCIQIDYLLTISQKDSILTDFNANSFVAIGCLVGALECEKTQIRAAFADTFISFSSSENRNLFRELFDPNNRVIAQ